jgi:HK97 gp10 family phage protein
MRRQVSSSLTIRTAPEASGLVNDAVFQAVQEVFELDIKPEAVSGSPVRRGTNRRSIDVEVKRTTKGTEARLFTQSGYGGYLELGTRFMDAKPYLFPAWKKFDSTLKTLIRNLIRSKGKK